MTGKHCRLLVFVLLVPLCHLAMADGLGEELQIREVSRTTETVDRDPRGNVVGMTRVQETALFHSVKVSETWVVDAETGQNVLKSRTTVEQDSEKNTVTKNESLDAVTRDLVVTQITMVRRNKDGDCETVVQTPDEFGRLVVSQRTVSATLSPDGDSVRTEEAAGSDGVLTIKRQTTTRSEGYLPAVR